MELFMKQKPLKSARRTYEHYSHLESKNPTPYEVVTTKLLYYPNTGFAVKTPVTAWYKKFQYMSCDEKTDWTKFSDPKGYIYTTYVQDRQKEEVFLAGICESLEKEFTSAIPNQEWLEKLENCYAPLVYPLHGLQMVAAYIGQMAPEGRISICSAFQAADEMRKIERIALHTAQIKGLHPSFGANRQTVWEEKALWQPLRESVEKLLVTNDWVEALVGLNLCIKPLMSSLFLESIGAMAIKHANPLLDIVMKSFFKDEQWHWDWASALIQYVMAHSDDGGSRIRELQAKWQEKTLNIVKCCASDMGRAELDIERNLRTLWKAFAQVEERVKVAA